MNEIEQLQAEALANDAWIAAIPDDKYALCPCGCGKKVKFILDNPEPHEIQFKKNFMEKTMILKSHSVTL